MGSLLAKMTSASKKYLPTGNSPAEPYSGKGTEAAENDRESGSQSTSGSKEAVMNRKDVSASDTSSIGSAYYGDKGGGEAGKDQPEAPKGVAPRADLGSPDTSTIGTTYYDKDDSGSKGDEGKQGGKPTVEGDKYFDNGDESDPYSGKGIARQAREKEEEKKAKGKL